MRETISVLEIDQPFCTLTYGVAPCTAALGVTGTHKCYNTRATCQDAANYAPEILTLRFAMPQEGLLQYANLFPSVQELDTTAGAINIGGMDRSLSALGVREAVKIRFDDHPWSDHLVDKYRLERLSGDASLLQSGTAQAGAADSLTLDADALDVAVGAQLRLTGGAASGEQRTVLAYDAQTKIARVAAWAGLPDATTTYEVRDAFDPSERGTFWGKWIARNPFYGSFRARVLQGELGQALADMRTRHYVIDSAKGPSDGRMEVTLKDIFSLIEARKAVAPVASQGELAASINATATAASLSPTGIGASYPADGFLLVNDELMGFTRVGDALTLTRGALGTVADEHEDGDLVQLVLHYAAQRAHVIIHDLLVTYGGIDPAEIDFAEWEIAAAAMLNVYTAYITEPEPLKDLIGELCLQAGCTVWPEPESGMIRLKALRVQVAGITIDDDEIVEDSLDLKVALEKRVSRVLTYYGLRAGQDVKSPKSYRSRVVNVDLDAEGPQQYGTPAIKEVFSRWIPQFGRASALNVGQRILAVFRNPPTEASFKLHAARDGVLHLAQAFQLLTFEAQGPTGAMESMQMVPTQIARDENEISIKAQELYFFTEVDTGERLIWIDQNINNINLRTIHDQHYAVPVGGEVVRFIVEPGTFVGGEPMGGLFDPPAIDTGLWPAGVDLTLVNLGRIQGYGGYGGDGAGGGVFISNGTSGGFGGTALLARYAISVDNLLGQLWGGGGGGGGGGSTRYDPAVDPDNGAGGGGGGGGAGIVALTFGRRAGYERGIGGYPSPAAQWGGMGTDAAGGTGGNGGYNPNYLGHGQPNLGGKGGDGGGPGLPGANGGAPTVNSQSTGSAPGTGGAAGKYIVGNSFVTWINAGDRRGGVA